MKKFVVLLMCISVFYAFSTAEDRLLKDMAQFDRAYIPALALTAQKDRDAASEATERLIKQWSLFKKTYYNYKQESKVWQKAMSEIESTIYEARRTVNSSGDLLQAHQILEKVRTIFYKLRKNYGIEYFLDYLTEFHEPMEKIVLTAKGKRPEDLTEEDIKKISQNTEVAERVLHKVINTKIDRDIFNISRSQLQKINEMLDHELKTIEKLKVSLETKDRASIIKNSLALKPIFAKIFKSFGDFKGLRSKK